ncbi:apolipoprotein N-acyltransferase [Variovorax boronicumulans]|uniref:apolipoprotein N-acyltransferase n=1 Tax=Variovorax boronicumulans TaxID=436515 RepID=UPI002786B19B|nr:apolipoprotein N-acyltransferase [Variovorax boronicumulans]MDP9920923.1 apolipoprotein N-acyltransferase [Variovorax boronicumulans]
MPAPAAAAPARVSPTSPPSSAASGFLRLLGFGLAGVAQALSIAWPGDGRPLWWLQLLSLAGLVWLLDGLRAQGAGWRRAGLHGWVFATAWLTGSFWWLFISMHTYGGLPAPLAVIAVLALAAALGLYYAVACAWFVVRGPAGRIAGAFVFAALWTLAELVRGSWFTGFPWGAGGYAHVDGPLAALAPWVGVYGIGAAAALAVALVARRLPLRGVVPTALAAMLLAAVFVLPNVVSPLPADARGAQGTAGTLQVALLQGNIPQDEKFIPGGGIETALRWYAEQLRDAKAQLVVTPETALPLLPRQLPAGYLDSIQERYGQPGSQQAAIVGLPLGDGPGTYRNAVLGFMPGGAAQPYAYSKHHLVPFGEFIPPGFRWFIRMMSIPLGDFERGGLAQAPFVWQGQRIAPNICYEDLFGDEIGANFRDEATAPTVLLNVSNIAWFGDSVAIDQHLAISRMRALEFARPMVRSTNTGATVVIDAAGRVTHQLPRLTRGVLEAPVEGRRGLTPFARWVAPFGLWPLWIAALAIVALGAVFFRPGRTRG